MILIANLIFVESSSDIDEGLLTLQTKIIMREWSELIIKPTVGNGSIGVLRLKPDEYLTVSCRINKSIMYYSTYLPIL